MITGRVYKIYSKDEPNKLYIGSTKYPLNNRLSRHKSDYKSKKHASCFDYIKFNNYKMELIEKLEVENIPELRMRERFFILKFRNDGYDVHNKKLPSNITLENGKNEYNKEYYESNKDELNKKAKEKFICEKCGGKFTRSHKQQHNKTNKHKRSINNTFNNCNNCTINILK